MVFPDLVTAAAVARHTMDDRLSDVENDSWLSFNTSYLGSFLGSKWDEHGEEHDDGSRDYISNYGSSSDYWSGMYEEEQTKLKKAQERKKLDECLAEDISGDRFHLNKEAFTDLSVPVVLNLLPPVTVESMFESDAYATEDVQANTAKRAERAAAARNLGCVGIAAGGLLGRAMHARATHANRHAKRLRKQEDDLMKQVNILSASDDEKARFIRSVRASMRRRVRIEDQELIARKARLAVVQDQIKTRNEYDEPTFLALLAEAEREHRAATARKHKEAKKHKLKMQYLKKHGIMSSTSAVTMTRLKNKKCKKSKKSKKQKQDDNNSEKKKQMRQEMVAAKLVVLEHQNESIDAAAAAPKPVQAKTKAVIVEELQRARETGAVKAQAAACVVVHDKK